MFNTFFQSKKRPFNSKAKLLTHSKLTVKPSRVIGRQHVAVAIRGRDCVTIIDWAAKQRADNKQRQSAGTCVFEVVIKNLSLTLRCAHLAPSLLSCRFGSVLPFGVCVRR